MSPLGSPGPIIHYSSPSPPQSPQNDAHFRPPGGGYFCDGSYTQYCDLTRQFDPTPSPNISEGVVIPAWNGTTVDVFIKDFARFDLLQYMDRYWINQGDTNAVFWAHEFSKHATCFSTWDTKCFSQPYVEHEEMINFFNVHRGRIYQTYPTGSFFRSAGIVPSNTTTYNLTQLQQAVKAHTGAILYFGCTGNQTANKDGRTVLDEVWYFNHVLGSPNTGFYKHIDSLSNSSCTPTGQIWYYERTPSSARPLNDVFWCAAGRAVN
ncbi:ribonuclease T2 [Calocera cornea HHB12733]|uniref:ribonuclease T2 n=1 Tax=Calocera cornea HHB12733 TaxID=1353952 RepID=A0A165CZJ4_9BASI|nr:ribonuclease T2 [Calocera cornea HHB12733]